MRKYLIIIILNIFLSTFFLNNTHCTDFKDFKNREREWYNYPPTSAKIAGMGNASVALIDNANTVFWNPGSITFINGFNNSYIPAEYPTAFVQGSARISNFSMLNNFKGRIAIGLNYRKMFDKSSKSNDKKEFSDLGILFGLKIKKIGIGINIKRLKSYDYINNVGLMGKGDGRAVDIGLLFSNIYSKSGKYEINYNLGIALLNVSKGIVYENKAERVGIPNIFKAGYSLSFNPLIKYKKQDLFYVTNSFEYSFVTNEFWSNVWDNRQYSIGFEVSFLNILFLRSGYYYNKGRKESYWYDKMTVSEYTYGFGVNLPINYFIKKIPIILKYDYALYPGLKKMYYYPDEYNISTFSIQYSF